MHSFNNHPGVAVRGPWRRVVPVLAGVLVSLALQGCITTAVIVMSQIDLPPACHSLSTPEQATLERCGGYKVGELLTKDVNTAFASACPLTNFAHSKATWNGLPELVALGADPALCSQAPLRAMAEVQACPDFAALSPDVREAVRWLARNDPHSVSGPVLHMLTCPSARQAGLTPVVTEWLAAGQLAPGRVDFSVLSSIHPASLNDPWVDTLLVTGHTVRTAVTMDATGYERALAMGDVATLRWWTQRAPELVHRVPAHSASHLPWVPLARIMTPSFTRDDAACEASARFLLTHGADPKAALPEDRSQTVKDHTARVRPTLLTLLAHDHGRVPQPAEAVPLTPKARALMATAPTPLPPAPAPARALVAAKAVTAPQIQLPATPPAQIARTLHD